MDFVYIFTALGMLFLGYVLGYYSSKPHWLLQGQQEGFTTAMESVRPPSDFINNVRVIDGNLSVTCREIDPETIRVIQQRIDAALNQGYIQK